MKSKDIEILSKLKSGGTEGYDQLFDLYYVSLCAHSLKFCDSFEMAEDIVQDLFISFWNDKLYLKIDLALGSYLYQAVKNNTLLEMRKNSRFIFEDLDNQINKLIEEEVIDGGSVQEEQTKLLQAIENLPDVSRTVFKSIVLQNMKYKDVASSLGISVNTVKTYYARALKKLRNSNLTFALLMLKL